MIRNSAGIDWKSLQHLADVQTYCRNPRLASARWLGRTPFVNANAFGCSEVLGILLFSLVALDNPA
jgi:hypothetical protein